METLKEYSFSDLIALRNHYEEALKNPEMQTLALAYSYALNNVKLELIKRSNDLAIQIFKTITNGNNTK